MVVQKVFQVSALLLFVLVVKDGGLWMFTFVEGLIHLWNGKKLVRVLTEEV